MSYPELKPFDFHRNGNANRRDTDAQPRVLMMGMEFDNHRVHLHVAGDTSIRVADVSALVYDDDTVSGMDPVDALRVGIEYGKARAA